MTRSADIRVKCLLVDDLEENLFALSALLRRQDVQLLTARSGAQALELLLANDVALALLDVQMPEMDGFELAELIRGSHRTRHVPLIFVTAGGSDQRRLFKGYETGAVDFLHKPIDPHILKSKAEVFFQLHRQKLELARQLEEKSETLRMNEMFMAVLGHDLRTPLGAILTWAKVLQRVSADTEVKTTAARMQSSGERMSRMIEDVLDVARARNAGGIALKRGAADFGTILQAVVQEFRSAYPGRLIDMQMAGDLSGHWDVDRLSQLASNLVGNSLHHGSKGVPVDVRLDGGAVDSVTLTIGNGGAIHPDLMPHIFDPFRGGERPAGRKDGLGLGLYIVQQVVRAHRGSVDVQSGDPERTVFQVVLPRT